ncbi:hypothetical protein B0F90DRAFT_1803710 [Multifurca ochricompacta]|uniref:FAD-binding FR-type domain-containing protein n=1 Tax=Multifurca ochricompacta TaxID=376703 RepID=A0AAD4LVX8_9AGAM|nr:hypothetical protein B0F90DRAFT_1803710 [Multifurca ochricompacta]
MTEDDLLTNIKSWKAGELVFHHKLSVAWRGLTAYAPAEHHVFPCSTSNLPFLPITTLDARGRPWTSILTGADGKPGFTTHSSCKTELEIMARLWEGDPLRGLSPDLLIKRDGETPVSGIGIELGSRKSYRKFAGALVELTRVGEGVVKLRLRVNQAFRRCPKYMTIRDLVPHASTQPNISYNESDLRGPLPEEVNAFIHSADTVFLGASYVPDGDSPQAPLYVETNIRSGRPGFIRVSPSDGCTIVLPDFSGNRLITSLGNNEAMSGILLASLTILSFTTGNVLYVTGNAKRLTGSDARTIMPRQNALTVLEATGAVLVRDALPVRERIGSAPVRSIYSPPVKLLTEEFKPSLSQLKDSASVRLVGVRVHSVDLATFEWELPLEHEGVFIQPGQAAVLDLAPFSDAPEYAQLALELPRALHDDRMRTWTVSSAHTSPTRSFELTIRHKPGGLMSGALFLIAQHQQQQHQQRRKSTCDDGDWDTDICGSLRAGLIGFAGAFVLPPPPSRRLLWASGGVGVTRFLAMLGALSRAREAADVVLVMSTRDPEVLFPLVHAALGATPPPGLHVRLDIFTTRSMQAQELMKYTAEEMDIPGLRVCVYSGRITAGHWATVPQIEEREVFVCGPGTFEDAMIESLRGAGAKVGIVHREVFEL